MKFILTLFMFSLPSFSFSQENFFFQGSAGITFPLGPQMLTDYWRSGLVFEGGVGYFLSDDLAIIGSVSYNYFSFSGKNLQLAMPPEYEITEVKGEKSDLLETSIEIKLSEFRAENALHSFFLVGLGFLTQRIGNVEVSFWNFDRDAGTTHLRGTGISDKDLFFTFAIGTEKRVLERFALSIEGRFLTTFDAENSYIPVKVGIRF